MAARLDLDAVDVRDGRQAPVAASEVDALEARLGIAMPAGYHEYVTMLGYGELASLQVLTPELVLGRIDEHRVQMSAFWLWNSGDLPFGQEEAMESIPIADTFHGDAMVVSRTVPDRIIVLPRHEDAIIGVEADVLALVEWICTGGLGYRRTKRRIFRPLPVGAGVPARSGTTRGGNQDHAAVALPKSPAEDTLLAYLRQFEEIERWYIERHGGARAFYGPRAPQASEEDTQQFWRRSRALYDRFCTPTLSTALGSGIGITAYPPHGDARILSIRPGRAGRVRIDTVHGRDNPPMRHVYTLEPADGEWRISAARDVFDATLPVVPPDLPERGGLLRSLFRR